jgi:ribonucleoside-diphosphate reductase alpha subunit
MRVKKRNGELEEMAFDKILNRLKKLGQEANIHLNYTTLAMKVIDQLYDGIETGKIDELAAEQCASMSSLSPDYGILAGRIVVSNHQKNTDPSFTFVMEQLYNHFDSHGVKKPLLSEEFHNFVQRYSSQLDALIVHDRDYLIDYFGFKTLERAYLFRHHRRVIERIQHLWLRVAVGIHMMNDVDPMVYVRETYDLISKKYFIHATPTLFNAGTPRPQMSSCYLVGMQSDSIEGIYDTLKDCALISKYAGGIGLHIHNIRAKGSPIIGTNGISNGIVPMLKVFNSTARYVDQGGSKRNGSFAIYLEPWHADIEDFLELRKNHGDEDMKSRDLFYALWVNDLFMERVKSNSDWSLFCPDECPGLADLYGEDFVNLYIGYEIAGKARKVVKARDLWFKILDSQMETGTPYLCFKDAANLKSNQKNLGTLKSSNLCTEIYQYSDDKETAVCNLASIALPSFVLPNKTFDFEYLHHVTKHVCYNLNQIIDGNFYPTPKCRESNMKHRPIGIGVQGLADTFLLLDMPFDSEEAKELNKQIFETMYHAALVQSNELAAKLGPYSSYVGSPAFLGQLQYDMWNVKPSDRYDWADMKLSIQKYGLRNSLLLAPMPTASTSQILGFNECFEPFTSNIYTRRTLAGEFVVVNKYLIRELQEMGQWNEKVKNNIVANRGSVQQLNFLSTHQKNKYKIVWEISMKSVIDMAADRGAFICQSQSMNLWQEDPTYSSLTSMHFYSWSKGLKTGMYYLRRKPKHQAQQFTIDPNEAKTMSTSSSEEEICEMCSA